MLSLWEFKEQQQLPLDVECVSVLYSRTAHLKDRDFVQIDRSILELIGFQNAFYESKGKLKDKRNDFSNAIKCLRNTLGFVEGSSLEDENAHFFLQNASEFENVGVPNFGTNAIGQNLGVPDFGTNTIGQNLGVPDFGANTIGQNPNVGGPKWGGHNKQIIWIRMRALEHFVIMANTQRSYKIREYFLDMKRLIWEYALYQERFHHNQALNSEAKKSVIINLLDKQLTVVSNLLSLTAEDTIVPVKNPQLKQRFVVLRDREHPNMYEIVRGQAGYVESRLLKKHPHKEVAKTVVNYHNPINLSNRFTEYLCHQQGQPTFVKFYNQIRLVNGSTEEDLFNVLDSLVNDKYTVSSVVSGLCNTEINKD